MRGLMSEQRLLVSMLIRHAARFHGDTEIVSRLVDGLTGCFDDVVFGAHVNLPLKNAGGDNEPQPVMKYCCPMLNRLLTTQ